MRALMLLGLVSGCAEKVDLTPTWPEGTTGEAVYRLNKEARVVLGTDRMRTVRYGSIRLQVTEAGDIGGDPLTLQSTHHDLLMDRTAQGSTLFLTTADEIPSRLVPDFDYEGVTRTATLQPDGTVSHETERRVDTDPEMLFQPLLTAPDGRVAIGSTWWTERETDEEETRYRTFKLDSVTDGVAHIRMLEALGHPTNGDLGPEATRVRGDTYVDIATGLPLRVHVRDKSSSVLGLDHQVDFTWEGVSTSPPGDRVIVPTP